MNKFARCVVSLIIIISQIFSFQSVFVSSAETLIPAFPGAEGGGMYASGGRGGDVYIVTNLDDYGSDEEKIVGSLRYGLEESDRTIVFNVSGNIHLKDVLNIKNKKNITIAGQTAPGDGITLTGYQTYIEGCENLIIRYMRFRTGSKNILMGDSMDAICARRCRNIIFDHLSTSWSTDETMSVYQNTDTTVSYCIISESLAMSGHSKGRHGYGAIWGGLNATFHHNIVASHVSRCPRASDGYGTVTDSGNVVGTEDANHIGVTDIRNNVFFDWNDYSLYGGGWSKTNIVNNYYKVGPVTLTKRYSYILNAGEANKVSQYYVSGNVLEGNTAVSNDNSQGVFIDKSSTEENTIINYDTPFTTEERGNYIDENGVDRGYVSTNFKEGTEFSDILTTQTAEEAYNDVLAKAGAVFPRRDAYDARLINEIKSGEGRLLNKEYEIGGLPVSETEIRDADFDKDNDGISDLWEDENGLDSSDSGDSLEFASDGSGYTNLEKYINSLVDYDYVPQNPQITMTSPVNNSSYRVGNSVEVSIDAQASEGAEVDKVEIFNGEEVIAVLTESPYNYAIEGLEEGDYYISAKVTDSNGFKTSSSPAVIHVNAPNNSSSWKSVDVGAVAVKGNGSLNNDKIIVRGNGIGLVSTASSEVFHFFYQDGISGDCEISAKIEEISDINNDAFAGISIRNGITSTSPSMTVGLSWAKSTSETAASGTGKCFKITSKAKKTTGSGTVKEVDEIPFRYDNVSVGYYVKIKKEGNVFSSYISPDGENWELLDSATINFTSDNYYVGFAVDSGQESNKFYNINTATFGDIKISGNGFIEDVEGLRDYEFDLGYDRGEDSRISDVENNAEIEIMEDFKYSSKGGYSASVGELLSIKFLEEGTYKGYIDFNLISPSTAKGVLAIYDSNDMDTPLAEVLAESNKTNPLRLVFDAKGGHSYIVKGTSATISNIIADKINIKTNGIIEKPSEETTETTTESTTETTTESTTESTTETTTERDVAGDVDCNGKVEVNDAAVLLNYIKDKNSVQITEQGLKNASVCVKNQKEFTASECAMILEKAKNSDFKFPVER